MRFGVPDMVSDTYYQLQNTTGSEVIGGKVRRNFGWVFSVVMVVVAFMMLVALFDVGKALHTLAFLGCAGLAFVGCAPNYCDRDEYPVHKGAAIVAAVGCVGWCLSVCWWVTLVVLFLYLMGMLAVRKDIRHNSVYGWSNGIYHPWYWEKLE